MGQNILNMTWVSCCYQNQKDLSSDWGQFPVFQGFRCSQQKYPDNRYQGQNFLLPLAPVVGYSVISNFRS